MPWTNEKMAAYKRERIATDPEYREHKLELQRAYRERNLYQIRERDRVQQRRRRAARRLTE